MNLKIIVDEVEGIITPDIDTPDGIPDQENIDLFYHIMTSEKCPLGEYDRLMTIATAHGWRLIVTKTRTHD